MRAFEARPLLHLEHCDNENDYEACTMYSMINCDDTTRRANDVIFPIRPAVLQSNLPYATTTKNV